MKRTDDMAAVPCANATAENLPRAASGRGFQPTQQQQAVAQAMSDAADQGHRIVVTGHAGAGKTTLLALQVAQEVAKGRRVCVASFTHRACGVVRGKLRAAGIEVDGPDPAVVVRTTSSLLGFREVLNDTDGVSFEQIAEPSACCYEVIFIDEASMIPAAHIQALEREARIHNLAVIYCGDPAQLPPVGHRSTLPPAFELSHKRHHLEQVHRNAGPILELATAARTVTPGRLPRISTVRSELGSVIAHQKRSGFEGAVLETLLNQQAQGIDDGFRILAGPNAKVQEWNRLCRAALIGSEAPPFVKGELLITRNAIWDWQQAGHRDPPLTGASAELEVLDDPEEIELPSTGCRLVDELGINVWSLRAACDQTDAPIELMAVEPADWDTLTMLTRRFADIAKAAKLAGRGRESGENWRAYFTLRDLLAHMAGPRFATTVHKAQGGEWPVVFIDAPSFQPWRKQPTEHRSMVYTAMTRAAQVLHILTEG
jgi:exodeoxyribonuclease-5